MPLPVASASAALGQRERNKLDKRERIRAAARELFVKHGYSATTMRDIASCAHVGLGTLFSYADDKRDLVFLIFNEDLAALTARALAAPRAGSSLVAQLLAVFRVHYQEFARNAAIARLALQELTFYSAGKQAESFNAVRQTLIAGVEALVRAAQTSGHVRSQPSAERIARLIFFEYAMAVRYWLATPDPDPAAGVRELQTLLELLFEGLTPRSTDIPSGRGRRATTQSGAQGRVASGGKRGQPTAVRKIEHVR